MKLRRFLTVLMTFCISFMFMHLSAGAVTNYEWENAYHDMLYRVFGVNTEAEYALFDVNQDGTPELFVSEFGTGGNNEVYVETYMNGLIYLNENISIDAAYLYSVPDKKYLICNYISLPAQYTETTVYSLNLGPRVRTPFKKVVTLAQDGIDGSSTPSYYINDNPVSYAEYAKYEKDYLPQSMVEIEFEPVQGLFGAGGSEYWAAAVKKATQKDNTPPVTTTKTTAATTSASSSTSASSTSAQTAATAANVTVTATDAATSSLTETTTTTNITSTEAQTEETLTEQQETTTESQTETTESITTTTTESSTAATSEPKKTSRMPVVIGGTGVLILSSVGIGVLYSKRKKRNKLK